MSLLLNLIFLTFGLFLKADAQVENVELGQGAGPCRQGLIICTAHCESFYSDSLVTARCVQRYGEEEARCVCTVLEEYCEDEEHEEECDERVLTTRRSSISATDDFTTPIPTTQAESSTKPVTSTDLPTSGDSAEMTSDSTTTTDGFTTEKGRERKKQKRKGKKNKNGTLGPPGPDENTEESESEASTDSKEEKSRSTRSRGKQVQKQSQRIRLSGAKPRGGLQISASQKQNQSQGTGGEDSESGDGDQTQKQEQSVNINLPEGKSSEGSKDVKDKEDCTVSEWTAWMPCSKSCDGGEQSQMRVIRKAAKGGGQPCPNLIETRSCNTQKCEIDCQVSEWMEVVPCSKSCGGGHVTQVRAVEISPQGTGRPCPKLVRRSSCNEQSCESESAAEDDIDCEVSNWRPFGECSQTCGRGVQTYIRAVLREKRGDGDECPKLQKTERCNEGPCRQECEYEEWSSWFECSVSCGKGITVRTRMVTHGGRKCKPKTERQPCYLRSCDPEISTDCQVLPWGKWSECNAPCGGGVQARTRMVIQQPTNDGRLCPDLYQTRGCNRFSCESSEDRKVKRRPKSKRREKGKSSKKTKSKSSRKSKTKSSDKSGSKCRDKIRCTERKRSGSDSSDSSES